VQTTHYVLLVAPGLVDLLFVPARREREQLDAIRREARAEAVYDRGLDCALPGVLLAGELRGAAAPNEHHQREGEGARHVGGGHRLADGQLLDLDYFQNGGPEIPDFHGGDENFRSVDYMAIPTVPMQTLATMIFDGVLDRFPDLKLGVIEQGASWVPSWMHYMDSAYAAFRKREQRLQKLTMPPSDFVRRQVRVTPYPAENVGWIVRNAGPEVCLFSSDYPHVEGGRNPIKRFEETMVDLSEEESQRFYYDNFVDLMGRGLPGA
jgi:hypothetical protein